MISTSWFHALIHDVALTGNGVYRQFGAVASDFVRGAFHIQTRYGLNLDSAAPLFDLTQSAGKSQLLSAKTSANLHTALRRAMSDRDGFGCPVARKGGPLPLDALTIDEHGQVSSQNPHIAHLIAASNMAITYTRPDRNIAHYALQHTAIDQSIDGVAACLRRYEATWGTPHYDQAAQQFRHSQYNPAQASNFLLRLFQHR